jgi:hypothetical protein
MQRIRIKVPGYVVLLGAGGELDRQPIYRDEPDCIRDAVEALVCRVTLADGDTIKIVMLDKVATLENAP